MSELHTTAGSIAAALRRAADALDAVADTEISPVSLQLNIQAVSFRGTSQERIDTVDALGIALVGEPGVTDDDDEPHHRTPFEANRDDATVRVYTAVEDFRSAS